MKRFLLLCILILVLASGCSYKVSKSSTKSISKVKDTVSGKSESISEEENTVSDNSEIESKEKNIISDIPGLNPQLKNIVVITYTPGYYVNNMQFTYNDLSTIINYAKNYGIQNPYVPTEGAGTDYIMEIRKDTDALHIVYPHFSVHESSKEIPPYSKVLKEQSIKLSIGNGVWRETEVSAPQLYLHLNGIYIAIDSAHYYNKKVYEKIAESMVHIKD